MPPDRPSEPSLKHQRPVSSEAGLLRLEARTLSDALLELSEGHRHANRRAKRSCDLLGISRRFGGHAAHGVNVDTSPRAGCCEVAVGGTQRLFSTGGMQSVRSAWLDRNHHDYGTVG